MPEKDSITVMLEKAKKAVSAAVVDVCSYASSQPGNINPGHGEFLSACADILMVLKEMTKFNV